MESHDLLISFVVDSSSQVFPLQRLPKVTIRIWEPAKDWRGNVGRLWSLLDAWALLCTYSEGLSQEEVPAALPFGFESCITVERKEAREACRILLAMFTGFQPLGKLMMRPLDIL